MPQNKYSQEDVRIILRAALKGDREAAVTLLQNYTNEMYFAARLYLEDKTDAKKTVQLAFNTAYTRLQEAETEQDFAKWLRSIVRECAVKRISPLQAETAEVPYSTEDERVSSDLSLPDEKTCRKYLLQGFGVFTPEERIVAAMRYYDHLTVDHIARILNTSRGHVEDWLSCGKEALHRSGILIGRIIALINAINDVPAEVEESYAPRHASSAVVFPEDPDNENTSFRNFRDLSNEPLPEVEEEKKVEEPVERNMEESKGTIVLPRMSEVSAPKVAPIEAKEEPVENDDDDDEEEEENSVVTTVIIVISLLILLGAGIFFLYQFKPGLFSWVPFLNSSETEQVPEETAVPTVIPTEAPVTETPVPEQPVTPAQPETPTLGTVTVVAEALNVRSSASMDGAIVGTVSANEQYQVLETYNDGTQNWYRIGDGQWITDGGLGYVNYVQ